MDSFRHAFGVPTFGILFHLFPPQTAVDKMSLEEGGSDCR